MFGDNYRLVSAEEEKEEVEVEPQTFWLGFGFWGGGLELGPQNANVLLSSRPILNLGQCHSLSHTIRVEAPLGGHDSGMDLIRGGRRDEVRSIRMANERTNERTDEMSNGRSTLTPPTKSIDAPARKLTRPSFERGSER